MNISNTVNLSPNSGLLELQKPIIKRKIATKKEYDF